MLVFCGELLYLQVTYRQDKQSVELFLQSVELFVIH